MRWCFYHSTSLTWSPWHETLNTRITPTSFDSKIHWMIQKSQACFVKYDFKSCPIWCGNIMNSFHGFKSARKQWQQQQKQKYVWRSSDMQISFKKANFPMMRNVKLILMFAPRRKKSEYQTFDGNLIRHHFSREKTNNWKRIHTFCSSSEIMLTWAAELKEKNQ